MNLDARIAPLRPLLGPREDRAADPTRARAPGAALLSVGVDPERAWQGRVALDRERVRSRPDDADAWWRLAMGLHALGRHDVASAAFARTLRRDVASSAGGAALVHCTSRIGLDFTLDVAAEAAHLPFSWVCTQPVVFERVRGALGAAGGRAYRIDVEHLAPLVTGPRGSVFATVCVFDAASLAGFPESVRCVRLPRRFVESPDGVVYDRVLCPTRAFVSRWTLDGGHADTTRVRVDWPSPDRGNDRPVLTRSIEVRAEASSTEPGAWSPTACARLVDALLGEVADVQVLVFTARERQLELRRAWFDRGSAHAERVRFALGRGSGERSDAPAAVIVEPCADAIARALHERIGPPVLVHDPSGPCGEEAFGLPVFDTALRTVAAVHARLQDTELGSAERQRGRARCFFTDADGAFTLRRALEEIVAATRAEAAAEG